ncbi:GGDEF domain-containing protein [Halomonas sp. HNIBRBA4712]|uniref:GGDEF domain-containing protein n=1 Tax=Halomonas sp. HNIBRBA4712 TaxID=3373087 RepID=UPI003744E784
MHVNDSSFERPSSAEYLLPSLPGVIFQLHRSPQGRLRFTYLEGDATILEQMDRAHLAESANGAIEQLTGEHWPMVEAAIERSARWLVPLTTRFQLCHPTHRAYWVGVSATPVRTAEGVRFNGMMMNITGQVVNEQRLERRCYTDVLTGLPNRRKLMMELNRLSMASQNEQAPFSIMMIDVDFFKRVNDRFGHDRGDEILKALAEQVRALLRDSDMLARLGGEEFVAVAPRTSLNHCVSVAERVREHIAGCDLGAGPGEVTVSIGIAEYRPAEILPTLLKRADKALYRAKDFGRDCVYQII